MKDVVGRLLMKWRIGKVLPEIVGKVIDVGCGTNELIRSYQGEGVGVDIYQWGDVDLMVEDSTNLPFDDEFFDTATCLAALSHMTKRDDFIQEAYRILRPRGLCILTVPRPVISRFWHFVRRPWDVDQKIRGMSKGEVYGLSPSEVRRMLVRVGFEIVKESGFMFGVNRLYVARKVTR